MLKFTSVADKYCDVLRELAFDYSRDKHISSCLNELISKIRTLGTAKKSTAKFIVEKCPFCGSGKIKVVETDTESRLFSAICTDCGASVHGNSEEEAVEKWNTRAPSF